MNETPTSSTPATTRARPTSPPVAASPGTQRPPTVSERVPNRTESSQATAAHLPLTRDRLSLLFLAAVLALNIALFLFLWLRFDQLPELLPMHFDAIGQADRIAPRSEIFILPIIGLIVASTNLILGLMVRRRSSFATYLLWGGAVLVEMLLFIAAYNITR